MKKNRRDFLKSCCSLGTTAVAANLTRLGLLSANAQGTSDYKALVCVFFFGGNDSNNMIVPIDLLKPILDDLLTLGRRNRPARPWLGLYATEVDNRVVVVGLSSRGPAKKADLRTGDIVLAVGGSEVSDLAGLFRRIWSLGNAGVEVPLTVYRDGRAFELKVASADRRKFLKGPRLH